MLLDDSRSHCHSGNRHFDPSEVLTNFSRRAGYEQQQSEKKLRGKEIADAVIGVLKLDERGFVPELAVFATNPF